MNNLLDIPIIIILLLGFVINYFLEKKIKELNSSLNTEKLDPHIIPVYYKDILQISFQPYTFKKCIISPITINSNSTFSIHQFIFLDFINKQKFENRFTNLAISLYYIYIGICSILIPFLIIISLFIILLNELNSILSLTKIIYLSSIIISLLFSIFFFISFTTIFKKVNSYSINKYGIPLNKNTFKIVLISPFKIVFYSPFQSFKFFKWLFF